MFRKRDKSANRDAEPNLLKEVAAIFEENDFQNSTEPTFDSSPNTASNESLISQESATPPPRQTHRSKSRDRSKSRENSKERFYESHNDKENLSDFLNDLNQDDNFKSTVMDPMGRLMIDVVAQLKAVSHKTNVPFTKRTEEVCQEYAEHLDNINNTIENKVNNKVYTELETEIAKLKKTWVI